MQTRDGVMLAMLVSLLMSACGNASSQAPAVSPAAKLDYSGIHRIYDRPSYAGAIP